MKRAATLFIALATLAASPVWAADWPPRPIHIIAPSTPGGAADTFARILAEKLAPVLGATFVVDNRAGGGGLIGVAAAAHAEADGTTLVMSSVAYNAIEPFVSPDPGFDAATDFSHIAYIGGQPDVFVVSAKSGLHSMQEVIVLARSQTVNYVSPGVGTLGHILLATIAQKVGLKLQHIPHRGSSQAMMDLVAGNVGLGAMTWGSAIGQIRAGTVIPVAVSTPTRLMEFPDVPTLRELGFDLDADSWFGLSGPAGIAPEIVQKLNAATTDALALPDVLARLNRDSITPKPMTAAEFSALVASDIAKWQPLVQQLGLRH